MKRLIFILAVFGSCAVFAQGLVGLDGKRSTLPVVVIGGAPWLSSLPVKAIGSDPWRTSLPVKVIGGDPYRTTLYTEHVEEWMRSEVSAE